MRMKLLLLAVVAALAVVPARSQSPAFDLILRGGQVLDGTGIRSRFDR